MQLLLAKAPIVLTLTSRAKGTEKHAKKFLKPLSNSEFTSSVEGFKG